MSKDKKPVDRAEQFAEEYCEILNLNIGPISRNDVVRAFITGYRCGEMAEANKDLLELAEYDPDSEDA